VLTPVAPDAEDRRRRTSQVTTHSKSTNSNRRDLANELQLTAQTEGSRLLSWAVADARSASLSKRPTKKRSPGSLGATIPPGDLSPEMTVEPPRVGQSGTFAGALLDARKISIQGDLTPEQMSPAGPTLGALDQSNDF
jgi:hypothetical protein